ncbi:MAG: YqaA family protein [Pseudomonadota bacterium]
MTSASETLLSLATLFAAAFGAATILPFQSEIVFAGLQARGTVATVWLIVVASIGNTLGSLVTYGMGRVLERYRHRKWFPFTDAQLDRGTRWFQKYGLWSLLLSWAPFGDAICIVSGVLRTPVWIFLLLVGIAKTLRYCVVAGIGLAIFG